MGRGGDRPLAFPCFVMLSSFSFREWFLELTTRTMEHTLKVEVAASEWTRLLKLQSERASVEAQIEEAKKALNLPSGSAVAETLGMVPGDKCRIIIVDGTGDQRGKGSVSYVAPTKIPDPRWQARYS
jgi:hypothetical protein